MSWAIIFYFFYYSPALHSAFTLRVTPRMPDRAWRSLGRISRSYRAPLTPRPPVVPRHEMHY